MDKKLSVILPVRNGEKYIHDAVKSVLNQTYTNFEFIIINDGSTDQTLNIINSFNDKRIKVITTTGIGLVNALNLAIENSSFDLIARMDADDICIEDRFEIQLKYFEDKNVGVVCSNVEIIDENSYRIGYSKDNYTSKEELLNMLTFKTKSKPIIHPSVMIRKELLETIKGYRHFSSAEDRDLWLRLFNKCTFVRIQKNLLKYRINSEGISKTKYFEQKTSSMMTVVCFEINKRFNIDIYSNENQFNNIKSYLNSEILGIKENYETFETFKDKIKELNKINKIYEFIKNKNKVRILKHFIYSTKQTRNIIEKTISKFEREYK